MLEALIGKCGRHLSLRRLPSKPKSKSKKGPLERPLLYQACTNLGRSHDKVRDQLKAHLAPTSGLNKTYKRNASLANLSFCFELQKDGENRTFVIPSGSRFPGIDPRQAALMTHLSQYGHTASAFGDVKRYVETFSQGEIAELFGKGIPILGLRFPWAWVDEVEDVEKPDIAPREEVSITNSQSKYQ